MDVKLNDILFSADEKFHISFSQIASFPNYDRIRIEIDFGERLSPPPIVIRWSLPGVGAYTRWSPSGGQNRRLSPNWAMLRTESRSASGMPIQCYLSSGGENRITVSLSDVKTPLEIRSGIVEETGDVAWKLILFSQQTSAMNHYSVEMRIDRRPIHWQESISETTAWWKSLGYQVSSKPDNAFDPLYSTWYSYHQNVHHDTLIQELTLAAQMGMKNVIVDDGWQTDDNGRGYSYCGVWDTAESKIPDMKRFADAVHNLGMKLMLWYSVPFVGIHSPVFSRFQGKYLYNQKGTEYILDPRFPDVRTYLVNSYAHAATVWCVDGMKLDFIDSFHLESDSLGTHPDMDTDSLEDAVCTLLKEIHTRLKSINPDILIEFRQTYVGPIMEKYGDMLRAADCPMDSVQNRIQTIDLRLTCQHAAVHSDMLMWNYSDTPESAADQLINVLFAVPQISVRLHDITPQQFQMLRFYLDFWRQHKNALMYGDLTAIKPDANYSSVMANASYETVVVSYADRFVSVPEKTNNLYCVNGTGMRGVVVEHPHEVSKYSYQIYNCMGEVIEKENITDCVPVTKFNIPVSGILEICYFL